jgi:pimeloyl-ACP methyl ester carboxylesterase
MLAYDRRGSGPPLLLVHGLGSHRRVWDPIVGELARHRDVIAVDLPGFGDSPPAGAGSVDHMTSRIGAFCADLSLTRPEVAGNSLGGGIALELGRRGLARAVTAFSPIGFWRGRAGITWCRATSGAAHALATALAPSLPRILSTPIGRATLCSLFFAHPVRVPADHCLAAARALANAPGFRAAHAELGHWKLEDAGALPGIPVTIAWGTRDAILPPTFQARRARTALPWAHHVTMPGCGHLPFTDDPELCAFLLTRPLL